MNRFLAIDDPLFLKWGRPTIVGKDNGENEYQCGICLASWVGPNGDHCYWCHKRWKGNQTTKRQRLLYPEWLDWGDSYFRLGKASREVWANTRGYSGNFISPWLARIDKAQANGEISQTEFIAAGKRCEQWINKMP